MKKAYKVVRKRDLSSTIYEPNPRIKEEIKRVGEQTVLTSAIVSPNNNFCEVYNTDILTPMGFVFKTLERVKEFLQNITCANSLVYLAECSVMLPWKDGLSIVEESFMQAYWDINIDYCPIGRTPSGSYLGFDIRLVKEIKI